MTRYCRHHALASFLLGVLLMLGGTHLAHCNEDDDDALLPQEEFRSLETCQGNCTDDMDCAEGLICTPQEAAPECFGTAAGTNVCISENTHNLTAAPFNTTTTSAATSAVFNPVEDACANVDTVEGLANCDRKCAVASCCFATNIDEACINTNPEMELICRFYAACAILQGAGSEADPSNSITAEEACTDDATDLTDCVVVCAEATCCFTTDIDKICDITNPDIACSDYAACSILYTTEPPPNSNTAEEACTDYASGFAACVAVCEEATCCFTTDPDKICDIINPDIACSEYVACAILYTTEFPSSNNNNNMAENACTDDATDLADCVAVCAEATCCFTNDIDKTCDITNPDIACSDYAACSILYGPGKNP